MGTRRKSIQILQTLVKTGARNLIRAIHEGQPPGTRGKKKKKKKETKELAIHRNRIWPAGRPGGGGDGCGKFKQGGFGLGKPARIPSSRWARVGERRQRRRWKAKNGLTAKLLSDTLWWRGAVSCETGLRIRQQFIEHASPGNHRDALHKKKTRG